MMLLCLRRHAIDAIHALIIAAAYADTPVTPPHAFAAMSACQRCRASTCCRAMFAAITFISLATYATPRTCCASARRAPHEIMLPRDNTTPLLITPLCAAPSCAQNSAAARYSEMRSVLRRRVACLLREPLRDARAQPVRAAQERIIDDATLRRCEMPRCARYAFASAHALAADYFYCCLLPAVADVAVAIAFRYAIIAAAYLLPQITLFRHAALPCLCHAAAAATKYMHY